MKTIASLALLIAIFAAAADAAAAPVCSIDPQRSRVEFTVVKFGKPVEGRFEAFSGTFRYDPNNIASSFIRWRVRVGSVETGAAGRDKTLQEPEYFDAGRHPELLFSSRRIRPLAGGALAIDGNLTMRGTTRPVSVIARPVGGRAARAYETRFEVDRFDYGVVGGRVMRAAIDRTVTIRLLAVPASTPGCV